MERRLIIPTLLLLAQLGCTDSSPPIQSDPPPPSSQNFSLESPCTPPTNPGLFLASETKRLGPNYQSTRASGVEVRNYAPQQITVNPNGITALYRVYDSINPNQDVIRVEGDRQFFKKRSVPNGTTILIHDQSPSQLLNCFGGGLALTVNPPQENASLPSVTEIALQRTSTDLARVTLAVAVEVGQQHSLRGIVIDYQESFNNGFGAMMGYLVAVSNSTVSEDELYQLYKQQVQEQSIYVPSSGKTVRIAVFSDRVFKLALREIRNNVPFSYP